MATSLGAARGADNSTIRSDAEKAFGQLTSASIDGLKEILDKSKDEATKSAIEPKFNIASVQVPSQTTTTTTTTNAEGQTTTTTQTTNDTVEGKLGVKVWFELSDGTLVNPTKRKWSPKERFYIHVQSAVPVYVALFQNYPESRPTTRQVYPDKGFPDSFKALQAGQETKLPVLFEMDDDTRDEIVSMVVVRADWEGIQSGLTAQATASVTTSNGSAQVTAQVTEKGVGAMKCVNERMTTKKDILKDDVKLLSVDVDDEKAEALCKTVNEAAPNAKFRIVGSSEASSTQANDVCFYMFGAGNVAQWQLTISK